jgi:hypothetical protein
LAEKGVLHRCFGDEKGWWTPVHHDDQQKLTEEKALREVVVRVAIHVTLKVSIENMRSNALRERAEEEREVMISSQDIFPSGPAAAPPSRRKRASSFL